MFWPHHLEINQILVKSNDICLPCLYTQQNKARILIYVIFSDIFAQQTKSHIKISENIFADMVLREIESNFKETQRY